MMIACLTIQNVAITDHVIKTTQIHKPYQNSKRKIVKHLLIEEVAGINQVLVTHFILF